MSAYEFLGRQKHSDHNNVTGWKSFICRTWAGKAEKQGLTQIGYYCTDIWLPVWLVILTVGWLA
jgi:hypothetical protein